MDHQSRIIAGGGWAEKPKKIPLRAWLSFALAIFWAAASLAGLFSLEEHLSPIPFIALCALAILIQIGLILWAARNLPAFKRNPDYDPHSFYSSR